MDTVDPPHAQVTSAGSTNCKLKIFRNKNSRKFQEAKLEFATSPTMIYIAFALC